MSASNFSVTPAIPADEASRVHTLHALGILDTQPSERFDRLTRLARRVFSVPTALVSLIDVNRQWTMSAAGAAVEAGAEMPRNMSFCAHAILGDDVLLVPDLRADPRFKDNPLVTGPAGVRFYAGYPIVAHNGSKLGTLCLLDVEPRTLSPEEQSLLRDLATIGEQEIVTSAQATTDELTNIANRRGFETVAHHALQSAKRSGKPVSLLFFDLNDFKKINDSFGHAEGDHALKVFAETLAATLRGNDVFGRLGGDEFVALLMDTKSDQAQEYLQRLQVTIDRTNAEQQRGYAIRYSVGQIEFDRTRHLSIAHMLAEADTAMYLDKQSRKAQGD